MFSYEYKLINDEETLFEILNNINMESPICFDCESNGLEVRSVDMVGFSFCADGVHGYYVPLLHMAIGEDSCISREVAKRALEIIFSHDLIGHNIKFDLSVTLHNFGIYPKRSCFDSMILAWLMNPNQSLKLDSLMQTHFSHKMIAFSEIVPKNSDFSYVPLDEACKYAAEDAVATFQLYHKLLSLCDESILNIAKSLEFPFIHSLCSMEDCGIAIDLNYFSTLRESISNKLMALQEQIHKAAGVEFNVNSTKQLAQVLFENLGLQTQKRGKSGYSTDESTLKALKDSHPIIPLLLEYREAFKLFSTYIEPFLKIDSKRIYTSFSHTGTNTGRLSSKSPNLQNIPVRSEMGKSIRGGFVAESGNVLVSLDYSQIELRLLTHFSEDSVLLESFANNIDIHAKTAGLIFKDKLDENFSHYRNIAKSINFGLIYGMGAKKLAQTLDISQKEAGAYIKAYFANFPSVKDFLERKKQEILERGYMETLIGRRRYFEFDMSNEFMIQAHLREGVNSIFQGSAADLIKLSMNRIFSEIEQMQRFGESRGEAKMLLQIHDELIFEIKEESADSISSRIKEIMENVYELRVPLVCNVSKGYTWADLK